MIDLSKNENVYGASPKCIELLKNITKEDLAKYSRNEPSLLYKVLMEKYNLSLNNILLGYGGEDILIHILEETILSKDKVLMPKQSWEYFTDMVKKRGGKPCYFNLKVNDNEYFYDVEEIKKAIKKFSPKLIIIASPNNPTGNLIKSEDLKQILDYFKGIIILDESYKDYSSEDNILSLIKYDNLIFLRTFSKYFGLAGVRIAFAFCNEKLKKQLKYFDRYLGISNITEKIAIESLNDLDYYKKSWNKIIEDRDNFFYKVKNLNNFYIYKSYANFILIKVSGQIEENLIKELNKNNIIVKSYNKSPFQNHIRITIGETKDMDVIFDIMKKFD